MAKSKSKVTKKVTKKAPKNADKYLVLSDLKPGVKFKTKAGNFELVQFKEISVECRSMLTGRTKFLGKDTPVEILP